MIFPVGQGLRGTHYDRVTCMHADRVEILHVTDSNGSIVCITHYLIFYLLVALHRLLNKRLMNGGEDQGILENVLKFLLVVGKAAPGAA